MKLKLSEAIRLGAMLKPQGYGMSWLTTGSVSCAVFGALQAVGACGADSGVLDRLRATWRDTLYFPILDMAATHPVTGKTLRVRRIVFNLNDIRHWTREEIADWVESIEQAQPQATTEQPDPVAVRA